MAAEFAEKAMVLKVNVDECEVSQQVLWSCLLIPSLYSPAAKVHLNHADAVMASVCSLQKCGFLD